MQRNTKFRLFDGRDETIYQILRECSNIEQKIQDYARLCVKGDS